MVVKGDTDASLSPPTAKADGLSHHLFFTHPNASSAEDAIFIFLSETLLTDVISRGKVLNGF